MNTEEIKEIEKEDEKKDIKVITDVNDNIIDLDNNEEFTTMGRGEIEDGKE